MITDDDRFNSEIPGWCPFKAQYPLPRLDRSYFTVNYGQMRHSNSISPVSSLEVIRRSSSQNWRQIQPVQNHEFNLISVYFSVFFDVCVFIFFNWSWGFCSDGFLDFYSQNLAKFQDLYAVYGSRDHHATCHMTHGDVHDAPNIKEEQDIFAASSYLIRRENTSIEKPTQ